MNLDNLVRIPGTDLMAYPLFLGAGPFGWTTDEIGSHRVLDAYWELGGNAIDTADMYADGLSETIIGNWIVNKGNRNELVIATKVGNKPDRLGLSYENIMQACNESLARLKTSYIDILFAHDDDLSIEPRETLEAFGHLIDQGIVRYIGASNFSSERLRQSMQISEVKYSMVQDKYNVIERFEYEKGLRQTVLEQGISNLPYFGLAKGFLTGKYRKGTPKSTWAAAHGSIGVSEYNDKIYFQILNVITEIAEEIGCSISAVALAWLRQQHSVSIPIASARTVEQLNEIAQVVTLTSEYLDAITKISNNINTQRTSFVKRFSRSMF